jgi:spore photoproduct lyase
MINRQPFLPDQIFVERSVRDTDLAGRIISGYPGVRLIDIDTTISLDSKMDRSAFDKKRNSILLTRQRGPFLRRCPGTPKHICCLYHNLDVIEGCDLDCSYCILQGYLKHRYITIYCNTSDMYAELERTLTRTDHQFYRIGTGELSDSLTFDRLTHLGRDLIEFFAGKTNAIIELKTKSVEIGDLLDLRHNGRTVVSWSLNSEAMAREEEPEAPAIEDRLRAAREIQKAGYKIGFHFDPMIEYEGWYEGYKAIVDRIFTFARAEQIAWISLGALRYPAAIEDTLRANFPSSAIYRGELLPGLDNKLRYFKTIRIDMFRQMYQWLRRYSADVFVYLCMEGDDVWQKAFGWSPRNTAQLKRLLDDRVK